MKRLFFTILICLNTLFCFSQTFPKKQTLIPLSNVNGVPYFKDKGMNDIGIDGFEVDEKGNFYFFGGEKLQTLAIFTGNKQILRKTYKQDLGQLYIYKKNLYALSGNDLITLNKSDGSIIKTYQHILNKHIDSYFFVDSSLIVGMMRDTAMRYEQYSLSGKYIKQIPNESNITPFIIADSVDHSEAELLGTWNGNYIFWDLIFEKGDSQTQKFWLVSKEGKVLAAKSLINKNNIFGRSYFENPIEHRKVRNGNLYVLGRSRTSNEALITEVPLQSFFYK